MARMLRAGAARWQIATPTYGYETKANLRVREARQWRRDADAGLTEGVPDAAAQQ